MPQTRPLRQGHDPIAVERVRSIFQVRRYGVIVDARREETALVVRADVLAGGAEHLQIGEAAHVQLTASSIRLADSRHLHRAGDFAANRVDPAYVGCLSAQPVSPRVEASLD